MTEEKPLHIPSPEPDGIDSLSETMLMHPSSALSGTEVNELISSRTESELTDTDLVRLARREDLLVRLTKESLRRKIGRTTLRHLESERNIRANHRKDLPQD